MKASGRYRTLIRTILSCGAAFALNYGITLVLTPYITDNVGTDAFGFITLAKNFSDYAVLITTALNSFATRYIAVAYHRRNIREANVYYSSVFYGDLILGGGIFAAALAAVPFLDHILNIPQGIVRDVKLLFIWIFAAFFLTTLCTVFSTAAYISDKLDRAGAIQGVSYAAKAAVLLVLYRFFPPRVYYAGVGIFIMSAAAGIGNYALTRRFTPSLRAKRRDVSGKAIRKLVGSGVWASISSLGNTLNNGLDLIVCNLMLTSLDMGHLAIAKTIDTIFHRLFQLVAQAFQPGMLEAYAEKNMKKLRDEIFLSMKVGGMFSNLLFAGFLALGMAYYRLWLPGQDGALLYRLTVLTVLPGVLAGPMTPLYYIFTLTVKRTIPALYNIAGGIMNVLMMYVLLKHTGLGVYAVAGTTVGVMTVINLIINPLYMARCLNLPPGTLFPQLIRSLISCAALCVMMYGLHLLWDPSTWAGLIACIALYCIAGALLHWLIVGVPADIKEKIHQHVRR